MITPLLAAALSAQTLLRFSVTSSDPLFGPDPAASVAAPGVWAVLSEDCQAGRKPGALGPDLARWPDCATPIRLEHGTAALLSPAPEGDAPPLRRLSTAVTFAPAWPGAPAVLQLEVPGLLDTTYVYAALSTAEPDAQGRFKAARLWPVLCPGPGVAGVAAERSGCGATTPTGVHEAARRSAVLVSLELRWTAP